jgi:cysteinyl-tRNA synthetase
MSMKLLGPSFDLHLGGEDLIFPHHEDEIAQSEGAGLQPAGEPFVRHWLHGAHLLVEGRKMSKSLGNYFTLRDLLAKGYAGREIRYLLLSAHYRETFNFTLENLIGARTALNRLDDCVTKLRELAGPVTASPDPTLLESIRTALDDDLNVSAAWAALFDWVRELNRNIAGQTLSADSAATAVAGWEAIDGILAVGARAALEIPAEITDLLEQRQAARKARDFPKADTLRDTLLAKGWAIEDTPKGPRLKPR